MVSSNHKKLQDWSEDYRNVTNLTGQDYPVYQQQQAYQYPLQNSGPDQRFFDPVTGQELSEEDYKDLLRKQQMLLQQSQHIRSFVSHSSHIQKMQMQLRNKVLAYMAKGHSLQEAKDLVIMKIHTKRKPNVLDQERLRVLQFDMAKILEEISSNSSSESQDLYASEQKRVEYKTQRKLIIATQKISQRINESSGNSSGNQSSDEPSRLGRKTMKRNFKEHSKTVKQQKTEEGAKDKRVHLEKQVNPKKRKQAEAELGSASESDEIKAKRAKLGLSEYAFGDRQDRYNNS